MNFRKYEILLLFQILLIAATAFVSAWAFLQDNLIVSDLYFLALLILEIFGLFIFINKQNKNLISFLEGMVHRDGFTKLEEKGSRKKIHQLLNQIAESYSTVKIAKENQHQYLLNTVRHVNIGLLSFNESGQIEVFNSALEQLLEIKAPKKLQTLNEVSKELTETIRKVKSSRPLLYKLNKNGLIKQLSIQASTFKIQGQEVKLVSLQDISKEIQEEEIEIWQKLIRVLTHEIMNSAGPITSLSSTLINLMEDNENINTDIKHKMSKGLLAIEKRSKGLAKFVETYRSLTKVPEPNISGLKVKELIEQVLLLKKADVDNKKIKISYKVVPENLKIEADEKLITQVLINIMNNALEAFLEAKEKGTIPKTIGKKAPEGFIIQITACKNSKGRTIISLWNNGPFIPEEILDKIFVPFYTTKEDGSGIGLSLSRQIMQKHAGNMVISSNANLGTEVILEF